MLLFFFMFLYYLFKSHQSDSLNHRWAHSNEMVLAFKNSISDFG